MTTVKPPSTLARYHRLIEPVREAARICGYAVAVHGSLGRDIDLIVVPWVEDARPPNVLAEAVREAIERSLELDPMSAQQRAVWNNNGLTYTKKPHGRICWSYYFDAECLGPYIDMSVMPRAVNA